jgi:hypothetical protein
LRITHCLHRQLHRSPILRRDAAQVEVAQWLKADE